MQLCASACKPLRLLLDRVQWRHWLKQVISESATVVMLHQCMLNTCLAKYVKCRITTLLVLMLL